MTDEEHKAELIQRILEATIFSPKTESRVIFTIFSTTDHYRNLQEKAGLQDTMLDNLVWTSSRDEALIDHLLYMMQKVYPDYDPHSSFSAAKGYIDRYLAEGWLFNQAVSYMLLSDDYRLGDRYHRKNESAPQNMHPSNFMTNALAQARHFQSHPEDKRSYYQLVLTAGQKLADICENR